MFEGLRNCTRAFEKWSMYALAHIFILLSKDRLSMRLNIISNSAKDNFYDIYHRFHR